MPQEKNTAFDVLEFPPRVSGVRIGYVVGMHGPGRCSVDFRGNPFGPVLAQRTAGVTEAMIQSAFDENAPILVVFGDEEPSSPIIFDVVSPATRGSGGESSGPVVGPARRAEHAAASAPSVPPGPAGTYVGRVVAIRDGVAWVDYDGNERGPLPAKATVPLRNLAEPVLLMLPANDGPIIVGQICDTVRLLEPDNDAADVLLQGRSVRIQATHEVVLRTGSCEIRMDANGRTTTTAEHVVSRARGVNKVQGGCIKLN